VTSAAPEGEHGHRDRLRVREGWGGQTTTTITWRRLSPSRGRLVLTVDCDPSPTSRAAWAEPLRAPLQPGRRAHRSGDGGQAIVATEWANLHLLPATPDLTATEASSPRVCTGKPCCATLWTGTGPPPPTTSSSMTPHPTSVSTPSTPWPRPTTCSSASDVGLRRPRAQEVLRGGQPGRAAAQPELQVLGMVPTFVNLRTNFSQQLLRRLADWRTAHLPDPDPSDREAPGDVSGGLCRSSRTPPPRRRPRPTASSPRRSSRLSEPSEVEVPPATPPGWPSTPVPGPLAGPDVAVTAGAHPLQRRRHPSVA